MAGDQAVSARGWPRNNFAAQILWGDVMQTLATRVKVAAARWIQHARYFSYDQWLRACSFELRIGDGNCIEERLCVGVFGSGKQLISAFGLDDLAEIHDRNPVTDMTDH